MSHKLDFPKSSDDLWIRIKVMKNDISEEEQFLYLLFLVLFNEFI